MQLTPLPEITQSTPLPGSTLAPTLLCGRQQQSGPQWAIQPPALTAEAAGQRTPAWPAAASRPAAAASGPLPQHRRRAATAAPHRSAACPFRCAGARRQGSGARHGAPSAQATPRSGGGGKAAPLARGTEERRRSSPAHAGHSGGAHRTCMAAAFHARAASASEWYMPRLRTWWRGGLAVGEGGALLKRLLRVPSCACSQGAWVLGWPKG